MPAPTPLPADNTITMDAVIIGAGAAGLFAAFELGLQGLQSHIVDALPFVGGQCVQLYGDKLIYDIPAIARCTGQELAQRLLEQALPFNPRLHLGQMVEELIPLPEQKLFSVCTASGLCLNARCVIIATGTGAFLPRTLNLDGLQNRAQSPQVLHQMPEDHQTLQGQHVLISGDLEETLQAANLLASLSDHRPASITLVHRRDKFRALEATIAHTRQLRQDGLLRFAAGQLTALIPPTPAHPFTAVEILNSADQQKQTLPTDTLLILHGLSPQTKAITQWGLALQGKQITVNSATFQTSTPGIFAIGDAITYSGKRKLILSSFHEAALAAFGAASYLQGGQPVPLHYTSSNTELQKILKQ